MQALWKQARENKAVKTILAIVAGFFASCLILIIMGDNPFELLQSMISNSFQNQRTFLLFVQQFGLYILLGLSTMFSLKVGYFNIGAPGQMIFAGMCASLFALHTHMTPFLHATITTLIAIGSAIVFTVAGAALKYYFKINDIVSSILLNWIALGILKAIYFNTHVFSLRPSRIDGATPSVPQTSDWIAENVTTQGTFTITIFIAIAMTICAFCLLRFTKFGYKIGIVGGNERASYIAGYNTRRVAMVSVVISGLMIGLFAMGNYFGKNTQINEINASFPPVIGFNGLILYIISNGTIVGLVFAALLMNFLQGPSSENLIGYPSSTPQVFAAIIIYFVAIVKLFDRWWDVKGYFQTKVKQLRNISQKMEWRMKKW